MRSSRYTCIESALMIVPPTRCAIASARADFPLAVGPATISARSRSAMAGRRSEEQAIRDHRAVLVADEELLATFGLFDQRFVQAQGVLDDFRIGRGFGLQLQGIEPFDGTRRQIELDAV